MSQALIEQIVILPDDLEAMIEESGKPQLPVGKYLAVITGGEAKVSNNGKNSYGVVWKLLINTNPDSLTEGWDTEAATYSTTTYTYIGKLINGQLSNKEEHKKGGFTFTKLMKMLGVSGKALNIQEHKGRQVGVIVEHVPSKDDREAMENDPMHVPDQLYVGIKTFMDYVVGDEHCPRLAYLFGDEGAEEVADTKVEDKPADEPKKKRGGKKDAEEGDGSAAW